MAFRGLPNSNREQQNKRGLGEETIAVIMNKKQTTQKLGKTQKINEQKTNNTEARENPKNQPRKTKKFALKENPFSSTSLLGKSKFNKNVFVNK